MSSRAGALILALKFTCSQIEERHRKHVYTLKTVDLALLKAEFEIEPQSVL
jgi:hypothetical protein